MENLSNVDQSLEFIQSSLENLADSGCPITEQAIYTDAQLLKYMRSECQHTRRWALNYRDRINIQINLVKPPWSCGGIAC